ncbi:MAG: vanadium-dependent haloperoxidase, partial [Saprospiraceae bacterium]
MNPVDKSNDLMRWQPKYFTDNKGLKYVPGCLSPQWGLVKTLVLDSASQFRSPAPPVMDSPQLKAEVKEVVDLQSKLTNEQRALVEFMRDGPKSVQQAGHWFIFAQNVSIRDQHTLDQDLIMYFLVEAAAMDAFIACWDTKMFYDYARPYALVHHYYKDQTIDAWSGPVKGKIKIKGEQWRPYSPDAFLCPPFPSYVSGHSTVSGACSEILRLFTGADTFGAKVKRVPGEMTETNRLGDTVTLDFPTFTNAADQAGLSRVLGGYHIQSENVEGLKLGRSIGNAVWKRYKQIYR